MRADKKTALKILRALARDETKIALVVAALLATRLVGTTGKIIDEPAI